MESSRNLFSVVIRYWPIVMLLALLAYFVTHAFMGAGSVQALRSLKQQEIVLRAETDNLQRQRNKLQYQVTLLRNDALDPDFLEESVRRELGYVYDDEVIVFLSGSKSR